MDTLAPIQVVESIRNVARFLDESLRICLPSWFNYPRDDILLDLLIQLSNPYSAALVQRNVAYCKCVGDVVRAV